MEMWDEDYFNMEVQADIEINERDLGNFQFGLVRTSYAKKMLPTLMPSITVLFSPEAGLFVRRTVITSISESSQGNTDKIVIMVSKTHFLILSGSSAVS
jgi:hypothetical protein